MQGVVGQSLRTPLEVLRLYRNTALCWVRWRAGFASIPTVLSWFSVGELDAASFATRC
jgi:hypothetical protein